MGGGTEFCRGHVTDAVRTGGMRFPKNLAGGPGVRYQAGEFVGAGELGVRRWEFTN